MNAQLTELLTDYGPIGAVWFDGLWDHDSDSVPFDWQLSGQYEMIHRLQPSCLIGNNHHQTPFPGEDIQIFERDLPGENTAGLSGQAISRLPLETCQTMNGMWGYKIKDQDYKDTRTSYPLPHRSRRTRSQPAAQRRPAARRINSGSCSPDSRKWANGSAPTAKRSTAPSPQA